MSLGERLYELRKEKHLSQEEMADKLNVTRQTVSKWETDQSTPDFDKIIPICELFGITTEELLTGEKKEEIVVNNNDNAEKRAKGIGTAILLFFLAIAWIMVSVPVLKINPVLASAIFMLIIGTGVCLIVYTKIVYKKEKRREDTLDRRIERILAILFLIIYMLVSMLTNAWHLTWIIWIIFALVSNIVKLIMSLKGDKHE